MELKDFSKGYDCFPHDLLLAEQVTFGFGTSSLNLLYGHHSNRRQCVKTGITFIDRRCLMRCTTGLNSWTSIIQHIFNNLIFCVEK